MNPQPAADSIWWRGNSPADGEIVQWVCTGGTTPETCTYCTDLTPHFAATGAAAAGGAAPPPPPDPAVLAQQAYQQIPIPKPDIHLGPNPDLVAVNIPVWLWVSRAQVAPVTVTAGTVTVTATPALTSVSWSMGEPAEPDGGAGSVPAVVCSGEGDVHGGARSCCPNCHSSVRLQLSMAVVEIADRRHGYMAGLGIGDLGHHLDVERRGIRNDHRPTGELGDQPAGRGVANRRCLHRIELGRVNEICTGRGHQGT